MFVCMSVSMYVLVTAHGGRCRVGSVGRCGNQADVAVALSAGQVEAADAQQAGILALHTYIHTYINIDINY